MWALESDFSEQNKPGSSGTKVSFVGLRIYPSGLYRTNADFFKKGSAYYVVKFCK